MFDWHAGGPAGDAEAIGLAPEAHHPVFSLPGWLRAGWLLWDRHDVARSAVERDERVRLRQGFEDDGRWGAPHRDLPRAALGN